MYSFNVLPTLLSLFAQEPARGLAPGQIKNVVTFGDSYSDVDYVWDGGLPWPKYLASYASVSLYPFAASGGTCSNELTPRPYPSLTESQIPKYLDTKDKPAAEDTLYTVWIGTNDVGVGAILTGGQEPGVTIVDTVSCAVKAVKTLYDNGARNILFQNMVPFHRNTLYAKSSETYYNFFWTLPHNGTAWNLEVEQLVAAGNALSRFQVAELAESLTDAHIGYFDSYGLFEDIIAHPSQYLNGTAPFQTTKPAKSCEYEEGADVWTATPDCKTATGSDLDSYVWYDELHPSEQTNRVLAKEIADIVAGKDNKWTTWLS